MAGAIQASGTVEAVQVAISPEMSGRVLEVLAEKGASVQAGAPLFTLDDALLQSQRQLALTGILGFLRKPTWLPRRAG